MRSIVGIFGGLCGLVAIALVARYGFRTADTTLDGAISAFLFGAIAAGGLGGHAVAARLWRTHKTWSILLGVVCAVALVVNLTNSFGAIAGRGERNEAGRAKMLAAIQTDRAESHRLNAELAALPAFTPMTDAGVRAAHAAVDAAVLQREVECTRRGGLCRAREADERARRDELAGVLASLAMTNRAARIEAERVAVHERLSKAEPVQVANSHGAALSRLFWFGETDAATAATWQQLAVAVIVELLIVVSLVAFELMGREGTRHRAMPTPGQLMPILADPHSLAEPANYAALASPEPRLPTSPTKQPGDVPAIMVECLEPALGFRVEIEDAYRAYVATCTARAVPTLSLDAFLTRLSAFCEGCQIETEPEGGHIYLVSVHLLVVPDRQPAPNARRRAQRSLPLTGSRTRLPRLGRTADPGTP